MFANQNVGSGWSATVRVTARNQELLESIHNRLQQLPLSHFQSCWYVHSKIGFRPSLCGSSSER
ncbi:hypothetical protein CCHR01_19074 [Colletotrichum chrysophilum]|uniref:Uncharacterized protein n=1 Tax=Colletotrichum chrysophilum TaxID=1836956 RepID=A0AAD9A181_9PEZI|nr:hypothetical protein CCHR01_19074 [Colletotrichum chrysophilum]